MTLAAKYIRSFEVHGLPINEIPQWFGVNTFSCMDGIIPDEQFKVLCDLDENPEEILSKFFETQINPNKGKNAMKFMTETWGNGHFERTVLITNQGKLYLCAKNDEETGIHYDIATGELANAK